MELQLGKDTEKQLMASIQRYCAENLGEELSELQASLFLRFCMEEIAPSIYNQAVNDAQVFLQEKLADLENTCFMEEFGYFSDKTRPSVPRKAGFRS